MKKIIVLALSVMMLLTCAAAYAGEAEKQSVTMAGAFSISYDKLPEYYTLEKVHDDELQFTALIRSTDAAKPAMILDIAFSDEWAGIDTLADVTEQDILEIQEDFYRVTELDAGGIWKSLPMPAWEFCRILSNLIDNAIDALQETDDKRLTLALTADTREKLQRAAGLPGFVPDDRRRGSRPRRA